MNHLDQRERQHLKYFQSSFHAEKSELGVTEEVRDYVLEEMVWMSSVYNQEVKTKKFNSKRCAKMVQKHFTDKVIAAKRAEREHQQNIRRIASFAAKVPFTRSLR